MALSFVEVGLVPGLLMGAVLARGSRLRVRQVWMEASRAWILPAARRRFTEPLMLYLGEFLRGGPESGEVDVGEACAGALKQWRAPPRSQSAHVPYVRVSSTRRSPMSNTTARITSGRAEYQSTSSAGSSLLVVLASKSSASASTSSSRPCSHSTEAVHASLRPQYRTPCPRA